jgi:hypothetical protein
LDPEEKLKVNIYRFLEQGMFGKEEVVVVLQREKGHNIIPTYDKDFPQCSQPNQGPML